MGQALASKLRSLFTERKVELCLVGLENSGKSSLLNVLSVGYPVETLPTVGLNVKMVKKQGIAMKVWDLGGQEQFRHEWPRYTQGCDCVIYVVDSADFERALIARRELHTLLEDRNLYGMPLLIALNKIDLTPRMTKEEIIETLQLEYATENPWAVVEISATSRQNISEVVDWIRGVSRPSHH